MSNKPPGAVSITDAFNITAPLGTEPVVDDKEYCSRCSRERFGADYGHLMGLCERGKTTQAYCDGCGTVWVDDKGRRMDR